MRTSLPVPCATAYSPPLSDLDSGNLGPSLPLRPLPLIPEAIRRRHHAFVSTDGRFKQAARFLQTLWREEQGLPMGCYRDGSGKPRKLGSVLTAKAGQLGGNFLDPEFLPVVNRALIYREIGAVYDLDRLRRNLLSSQPLAFNLFVPLALDHTLATRMCAALFPGVLTEVTQVTFEHSPGRGDPRHTGDGTAFDVVIRGRTPEGSRGLIAIEIKYSETAYEALPRFTGCFDAIAPRVDLFRSPTDPRLRANPIQQLFRQHCLAATILEQDLADTVVLALFAPAHNHLVQAAARTHADHLLDPVRGRIPFVPLTLEQGFAALAEAGRPAHARALHRRYTDFGRLEAAVSAALVPRAPVAA